MATVYTIGHSSHEWAQFAALLGASKITALADARSSPSSRYPHFSRAALKARLNACGIAYLFTMPARCMRRFTTDEMPSPFRNGRNSVSAVHFPLRLIGVRDCKLLGQRFASHCDTFCSLAIGCTIRSLLASRA